MFCSLSTLVNIWLLLYSIVFSICFSQIFWFFVKQVLRLFIRIDIMVAYIVFKDVKCPKIAVELFIKDEQEHLVGFIEEFNDGGITGKRLSYDFFRGKKIDGKRVYL